MIQHEPAFKRLANEVREKLRRALIALNHLSNHSNPYFDTLQMRGRGVSIAKYMVDKMHVKANEIQILEALAYLANMDKTLRGWHSSIGYGDGLDKWEWALPLDLVPDEKK